MKQLLSLFLLLLPCLAWAQYSSNGNQKITLGEQSTADGLIYRGLAADTTRKPSIDTMAYIILDTATNIQWHYKKATSNAWLRINLLPSDTSTFNYVNTYGSQTVNGAKTFTSVINSNVQNASFITATGTTGFVRGQIINTGGNFVFGNASSTGETPFATSPYASFFVTRNNTDIAFGTNDLIRFTLKNNGNVGIGQTTPTSRLVVKGSSSTSSTSALNITNSSDVSLFNVRDDGLVTLGTPLPVASGGTNTSTAFTTGSVVFAGASGTYTQDNSGLFFNTTSNLLGIGNASPAYALDVIEDNEPSQANSFAIARFTGSNAVANDINIIGPAGSQVRMNFGRVGAGQDGEMGYNNNTRALRLVTKGNVAAVFDSSQRFAINLSAASARLHISAGVNTVGFAPLKFTSGTNLTTAEAGAMEFNGTNLFFSPSTVRHTVNHGLTGSATLNFPSTLTMLSADLTITVTGAADGDVVSLGVPNAAVNANTSYSAWVSATNTVTVRFNNYSIGTVDPSSGSFKVFVTK